MSPANGGKLTDTTFHQSEAVSGYVNWLFVGAK